MYRFSWYLTLVSTNNAPSNQSQINHYPVDKYQGNELHYPVDNVTHLSNYNNGPWWLA